MVDSANFCGLLKKAELHQFLTQFTVMGLIVDNLMPENFLKSYQIGEVFLLIGFFYTIKRVLKTLWNLHDAFKTFVLPLFWPRNFPEEYGSWAGQSDLSLMSLAAH